MTMTSEQLAMLDQFDSNLIDLFVEEVQDRAEEIDPNDQEDWSSLIIGWAIAKGLKPADARTLCEYIHRFTEYG